jgi:hypothetical protein
MTRNDTPLSTRQANQAQNIHKLCTFAFTDLSSPSGIDISLVLALVGKAAPPCTTKL